MTAATQEQLWPSDKLGIIPFSYAKAIIKDETTYPIVPNCPIVYTDENLSFDYQNIPAGTIFIIHIPYFDIPGDWGRVEHLAIRVPNETNSLDMGSPYGYLFLDSRSFDPDSGGK